MQVQGAGDVVAVVFGRRVVVDETVLSRDTDLADIILGVFPVIRRAQVGGVGFLYGLGVTIHEVVAGQAARRRGRRDGITVLI